jgi:ribose transport system permease protein
MAIGFINGLGIVVLGISPIIMTLAMNGILQGAALIFSNGSPIGWSPPALRWLMTGRLFDVTPVVWCLLIFVVLASLLLSRTTFGRRLYATGNSERVARFAGVPVGATLVGAYMLSGFCAALVGVMLSGFSGQAFLEMGDPYLLPSIAVVVVGGTTITGGKGHYVGMFGGALLLTALSTVLSASLISDAIRGIVYGSVVLIAMVALRERAPA